MSRKLIVVMLAWLLVFIPLTQISNAQLPKIPKIFRREDDDKETNKDKEREQFRKEAAGQRGKCGKKGRLNDVIDTGRNFFGGKDPFALTLGKLFNDQLPIKLDACSVYDGAPTPENFDPVFFQPTTDNFETPLPPGDYTIPVRAICTKDSIHIPGRGVGYKLAPLEGKQAAVLATLVTRGNIAGVPHDELQKTAWYIQSGIPYSRMPKTRQTLVDELIPDYKTELSGDFLQRTEERYNNFAKENSRVLPFDKLMEQAGIGANIRSIRRSREIIRDESLDAQRMQQRLFDGEPGESLVFIPDKSETSPWSEIQPGVYVQFIVKNGWQGINELNLRITPQAAMVSTTTDQIPAVFYQRASFVANKTSANPGIAIAGIFGIIRIVGTRAVIGVGVRPAIGVAVRYGVRRGLIGYSVNHATQALIILPNTRHGDSGGEKEPSAKKLTSKEKEKLIEAALESDRNDLTKAGRAYQKHMDRPNSPYPKVSGNQLNRAGESFVKNTINDPNTVFKSNRSGGIDAIAQDGRGVRYNSDGSFYSFINP